MWSANICDIIWLQSWLGSCRITWVLPFLPGRSFCSRCSVFEWLHNLDIAAVYLNLICTLLLGVNLHAQGTIQDGILNIIRSVWNRWEDHVLCRMSVKWRHNPLSRSLIDLYASVLAGCESSNSSGYAAIADELVLVH